MNPFKPSSPSRSGFTLVETLVCVALLAMVAIALFAWLSISTQKQNQRAGAMRVLANGSGIYKITFMLAVESSWMDGGAEPVSPFPKGDSPLYATSTGYFQWLFAQDEAGEFFDPALFAGGDVRPASSLQTFSAENNLWSVVVDVDEMTPAGTPYLISRNINEDQLQDGSAQPRQRLEHVGTGRYPNPPGEFVWVVYSGGSAQIFRENQWLWDTVNPTANTNKILNP